MNRLTKREEYMTPIYYSLNLSSKGKTYMDSVLEEQELQNEMTQKLGKLEDLEEELGFPLEVVFKALMLGITVKNNDDLIDSDYADKEEKYVNFSPDEIYIKNYPSYGLNNSITHSIEIVFGVDGEWSVYLKDYQKTWWLRGEKDE